MAVLVTPVNKITLSIGTDQVECQITSHELNDADPAGGEQVRTGCGDIVTMDTDSTEVGTLNLTLFPPRGDTEFLQWTWAHAGETVAFELVENPGEPTALQWSGELTLPAMPARQDAYTKKETVDMTFSITEWTDRAVVPTP